MPFGKYKGKEIHRVNRKYLIWVLDTCSLTPELQTAVQYGIQQIEWNPPNDDDLYCWGDDD